MIPETTGGFLNLTHEITAIHNQFVVLGSNKHVVLNVLSLNLLASSSFRGHWGPLNRKLVERCNTRRSAKAIELANSISNAGGFFSHPNIK